MDEGGYTGWMIGSGAITIGPHDQVKGKSTQPGRLIWNIESSDVRGDFERLKAAGGIVITEPYEMGEPAATIATFADPDDTTSSSSARCRCECRAVGRARRPVRGPGHAWMTDRMLPAGSLNQAIGGG